MIVRQSYLPELNPGSKRLPGKVSGVTRKRLSALLNGRLKVSPEMALRLYRVFGHTPEGWLKLQLQFDLGKVRKKVDLSGLRCKIIGPDFSEYEIIGGTRSSERKKGHSGYEK
ncbi:MAG: addiction module antidote protein, HigA family [Candidatus Electrothrix sp. LOE2]|nr:addiction module antidote protein, HigA family [Candidatus Electrothrix sp. LOE2]